jgi:hypothetical protein
MGINENLEFLKREGRTYSFPEPKHEEKDGNKFRLLVLGLLVCVLAAICSGQ